MTLRSLLALALAAGSVAAFLGLAVGGPITVEPDDAAGAFDLIAFGLLVVGLAVVGGVVSLRRPEHPIGWLFLVAAALTVFSIGVGELVARAAPFANPGPVLSLLAWVGSWTFIPTIGILIFAVPLLFPTGRLPSRRWRPVVALAVVGIGAEAATPMFRPGPIADWEWIDNPLGIRGAEPVLAVLDVVSAVSAPIVLILVIASLVSRYRHASAAERAQLRWFLYPTALALVWFAVALSDMPVISEPAWVGALGTLALVPPAVGIAILRHGLFEIDRIVSRTLTYAFVSALLAAIFLGLVLLLQGTLGSFIGDESPIVVAASTLVVAALFQPLRQRVQAPIDRRFNRSRYDAQQVIDGFSSILRDEPDRDALVDSLSGVAQRALAPRFASVWLRERESGS